MAKIRPDAWSRADDDRQFVAAIWDDAAAVEVGGALEQVDVIPLCRRGDVSGHAARGRRR